MNFFVTLNLFTNFVNVCAAYACSERKSFSQSDIDCIFVVATNNILDRRH
jgi:hypothetical protein